MENKANWDFSRKVTGAERFFLHSPFSTVTMIARVKGELTGTMLKEAVRKVQGRHGLLRARIKVDEQGDPWFTTEGSQEIPVVVVPRQSDGDWIKIHSAQMREPYEFESRPAVRIVLAQSPTMSEVIILCHHMICDGLSLAYLARDLLDHLGDPEAERKVLPAPEPINLDNIPGEVAPSGLVRFFINRIKKKWSEELVSFDQADYQALNRAYWSAFQHEIIPVELTEDETTALAARCRAQGVTVNSALLAAFTGALEAALGPEPHRKKTVSAVSLRERLPNPPGEGLGYYAQGVEVKFTYNQGKAFWDNARDYHRRIAARLTTKKVFGDYPAFLAMDSNIYEALSFKKLGGLVDPDSSSHQKLASFSERQDIVVDLLKRAGMETLDTKLMGAAVTNLGRLEFPRKYGDLELERLIMQPGGAFPLVHVDLVVGAVTCAGRLSLVLEYAPQAVRTAEMIKVKDRALEFLAIAEDPDGKAEEEGRTPQTG